MEKVNVKPIDVRKRSNTIRKDEEKNVNNFQQTMCSLLEYSSSQIVQINQIQRLKEFFNLNNN